MSYTALAAVGPKAQAICGTASNELLRHGARYQLTAWRRSVPGRSWQTMRSVHTWSTDCRRPTPFTKIHSASVTVAGKAVERRLLQVRYRITA